MDGSWWLRCSKGEKRELRVQGWRAKSTRRNSLRVHARTVAAATAAAAHGECDAIRNLLVAIVAEEGDVIVASGRRGDLHRAFRDKIATVVLGAVVVHPVGIVGEVRTLSVESDPVSAA